MMIQSLSNFAQLEIHVLSYLSAVVFVAGLVRGFSGFALSAIVMAGAARLIAPVELIPICYILEGGAGLVMLRSGIKDADFQMVWGLAIGSALGVPIGLAATVTLPADISKLIAMALVMGLASLQLLRTAPAWLNTKTGLYGAGLLAGIITGLASVGGMLVALYVLAAVRPPAVTRASLVMFLFISMFTSLFHQLIFGVMNETAFRRGLILLPIVFAGVWIGTQLFRPSLEKFYRQFCLILLIALAAFGMIRMM